MRETRAQLITLAKAILDETPKGKQMSAENDAKFDELMAEADLLKARIDREDNFAVAMRDRESQTGERRAFRNWLQLGKDITGGDRATLAKRKVDVQASMGIGSGTGGGFTVPDAMHSEIVQAQKAFGGMLDCGATVLNTSGGNPYVIPLNDDTSQMGNIVGENVAMTDGSDLMFKAAVIGGYMYSSKPVKFSVQLAEDSEFDIEGLIAANLGTRIARRVNLDLTSGTGIGQPRGLSLDAAVGTICPSGSTTTIDWEDLLNLEHSVDAAYRRNAKFMFADSTLKMIKKLKDAQNRPLWLPGLAAKEPDTINGYPFVINYGMPVPAANATTIAFGDFSKYFIRRIGAPVIVRLSERYADVGQVAFLLFQRWDGKLVDAGTHPIATLQQSPL